MLLDTNIVIHACQPGGDWLDPWTTHPEAASVREIQVDDARTSAFPSGRQCHAGFAQAPASDEKVALLRIPEQFILERPEFLVVNALDKLTGEDGCFDESQRREEGLQCNPI